MSNKLPSTVFFIGIAAAIGIYIGSSLNFHNKTSLSLFTSNSKEKKIKRLINYIQYDYVEEVNTDSLLDDAINHLLLNLDPHSVYIPKSELQSIQESMNGSFYGIGIQFRMIRDTVTVLNIIKGGPSEKAGLLAGDRILIADQDTIFGKSYSSDQIMDRLKGKEKNEVTLNIYRKQTDESINFTFNRGSVNLVSVPIYYMINDDLGYINIERFAKNTYEEFHAALKELKEKGMQTLILDLRGNTGGYLDIANEIADEFLEDGKLIVFTKNKYDKVVNSYASSEGIFEKQKLYVLIDEESASASEIVAGALQDNDKGIIVGRRSFGKGLVQQEMDLGDGSAIRLTTAKYYTPTGRSIQKPYDHNGNKNYYNELKNRSIHGELTNKDSIQVIDSLKYTTPKGKIVYGGGGIIPDIFVPVDSIGYFPAFHYGNINNFVFDYIDNNRQMYADLSWEDFDTTIDVDKVLDQYIKTNKTGFHKKITKNDQMKRHIKALFARELFGDTGFFRVYEPKDNMIQKVLNLEKNE
jgi:carboxyl-terminal processing protease